MEAVSVIKRLHAKVLISDELRDVALSALSDNSLNGEMLLDAMDGGAKVAAAWLRDVLAHRRSQSRSSTAAFRSTATAAESQPSSKPPAPAGWQLVPSNSRPGVYVYENQQTGDRQDWFPEIPTSLRQPTAKPHRRLAVLIGNSDRHGTYLKGVEEDMRLMSEALKPMKFEVRVKRDLDDAGFGQLLKDLRAERDVAYLWVHYSGHGDERENKSAPNSKCRVMLTDDNLQVRQPT